MRDIKYRRIAAILREKCASLAEGTQLPSEKELAAQHDVSTMTVRQALEVLQEEGFVERVFGRGTYVQCRVKAKGDSLTSFSEDMRMRGLEPSTRLLGIEIILAPDAVALDLRLGPSEKVLVLERLRFADREPMCLETTHLPDRFARAIEADPDSSVHETLNAQGVRLTSETRRIRAVETTARQSSLLGLPTDAPALRVIRVSADEHGRPVQRADTLYRADRYEAYARVHRT